MISSSPYILALIVSAVQYNLQKQKNLEILFNFLWRFQPFCYIICFLRDRYALSYQSFNLLYISMDVALI